jgi:hypothetical protein
MTNDATRASAEIMTKLGDVIDIIARAQAMVELTSMAGAGLVQSLPEAGDAITMGCEVIAEALANAKAELYAIKEGGEA